MVKLLNNSCVRKTAFFSLALLPLVLTAPRPTHAKINVVTSIKPVHSLVAGLMRGVDEPHLLVKNGSPHNYALKPSDARALQSADLVIWVGPELESFLIKPLKALTSKKRTLALVGVDRLTHLANRTATKNKSSRQKAKEHHSFSAFDPHIWLDPQNAIELCKAIKARLIASDPQNAEPYLRNFKTMKVRLKKMISDFDTELSSLKNKPFLTFHDSFQYFEKRFGLKRAGSIAISPERQPGVRHLKKLKKQIVDQGIVCVFSEPQFRSSLIDLIIEGTSARTAILDPIGASIKKGPQLYFTLLQNNARAFISCLGGS